MAGSELNDKEKSMDYKELLEAVCEYINEQIEDANAVITSTVKNNGVKLSGITVSNKEVNASPTIYMENFYLEYLKGMDINEIGDKVIEIYRNNALSSNLDVDFFQQYDSVKDKLRIKLINYERNLEFFETVPYRKYYDLAIIAYCAVNNKCIGKGAITVRNEHLKMWNVSKEEVINQAIENSVEKIEMKVRHIYDILKETEPIDSGDFFDMCEEVKMYVVSSQDGINGAVFMTMKDKLREIGGLMDGDYYIIPSSVHELIIIPATDGNHRDIDNMICEVNENHVGREEVLSNHSYYYNVIDETLLF